MFLHFLKATDGTPLTKSFTLNAQGQYEKTAYPSHLYEVDSAIIEVQTIDEFHSALSVAAGFNQALQKGELDRELHGESRANHTLTDKPTKWVLFDIDGLPAIGSAEEFVQRVLPDAFHNVSYIVQYSASSGIVNKGLSAHVFFVLKDEVAPNDLKNWLRTINLENPVLEAALELQNGNHSALRWPLDVTVAGNDKYVYIAPPVCTNFEDPLTGKRIQLVRKSVGDVGFAFSHPGREGIRQRERAKIQTLRDGKQLPKLSLRTSSAGGFDVLLDADPIEVTDWWFSNGFFHLNINGGDSGAYWVNPKKPKYIHSFKDEPSRILKQCAPEFWKEIKDQCAPEEMLVFRDKIADLYYCGKYDPIEDEYLELYPIKRTNLKDWCEAEYTAAVPDPVPQYMLRFDPTETYTVDRAGKRVNLFQKTEYMTLEPDKGARIPSTIDKVISHVVNHDEKTKAWLVNWLAFIFQRRTKSRVAVVLHGTKGTGKGVLFNEIIKPLLGGDSCQEVQQNEILQDRFNEYLGRTLVVMLDESEADDAFRNKLYHWITEPNLRLRVAYAGGKVIESHTNFILASNKPDAAPVEDNDRRFTVAPRQLHKIDLTHEEVKERIPEELSEFARFLLAYEVDEIIATTPLENEAKDEMREAARDSIDMFIDALMQGDFQFFVRMLDTAGTETGLGAETAIKRWAPFVNTGKATPVTMAELQSVYRLLSGNALPVTKFSVMLRKRGVPKPEDMMIGEHLKSAVMVEWKGAAAALSGYKHLIGGVKAQAIDGVDRVVLAMGTRK
jgi:hypothetical protein